MANSRTRTKIVCTIGPSCDSPAAISQMARAGMDVARLNFSHATQDWAEREMAAVRQLRPRLGVPLAILADLQGPRIRTGKVGGGKVELASGRQVWIDSRREYVGSPAEFCIPYGRLAREVKPGSAIFIDGGMLQLKAQRVDGKTGRISALVVEGGVLHDHKGVNLPGADLSLPSITEKDYSDLHFLKRAKGADYVAMSFVRSSKDVVELKRFVANWPVVPRIIAKIETAKALQDIDRIIEESDGIMVARGDLGVELKPEDVPVVQKELVKKCNAAFKPVIIATQMLESMIYKPVPTRAEASDVANAVLDGADALMLSAETSIGKYPVGAVGMMTTISRKAEALFQASRSPFSEFIAPSEGKESATQAISSAVVQTAAKVGAKLIVAHTASGFTAKLISKLKPPQKIVAFTPSQAVFNQCALLWGVEPLLLKEPKDLVEFTNRAQAELLKRKMVATGDVVVVAAGIPFEPGVSTNVLKIHRISGASQCHDCLILIKRS